MPKRLFPALLPLLLMACGGGPGTAGPSTSALSPPPPGATAVSPSTPASTTAPAASGPGASDPAASGELAILPLLISPELAVGPTRFLFSLTDAQNRLIAAPDVSVDLEFYDTDTDPDTVVFEAESRFIWALEGERGLYVADVDFPDDGRWGTRFTATFPDGRTETVRADYDVLEDTRTPSIGEPVPSVETPTAASVGGDLRALSTDPDPEPRFYQTSLDDALAAGEPFVMIFATPAFCETRTCGPTLETAKEVAAEYPELTFINAEPFIMEMRDGSLQPVLSEEGELQTAPWTEAWQLVSEPFVAVVDAEGILVAKFAGVLAADELRSVLETL